MESTSFWNPESTVLESGIQCPGSGIHSMESRIQDCPGFPYMGRPDGKLIRKEILEEAEFYQIRGIVNKLHPPPFLGSNILSDEQKRFILNSCLKLELRHSSFVLIYRASRDG